MLTARVTSKGQITIPADVRRALKIDQGDDLTFEVTSDRSVQLKVLKRRRLSDLYGSLPATRSFPGKEEAREEVGRELGKTLQGKRP
jgi:AbrB family looped-hinge helix DNA binding protein